MFQSTKCLWPFFSALYEHIKSNEWEGIPGGLVKPGIVHKQPTGQSLARVQRSLANQICEMLCIAEDLSIKFVLHFVSSDMLEKCIFHTVSE